MRINPVTLRRIVRQQYNKQQKIRFEVEEKLKLIQFSLLSCNLFPNSYYAALSLIYAENFTSTFENCIRRSNIFVERDLLSIYANSLLLREASSLLVS